MTGGYFFRGNHIRFEEAFPDIENIKIEATERNLGSDFSSGRKMTLDKENFSGIEPCGNRLCKKGGHNIGDFISEMYNKKETSKENTIMCGGHENMGRWKTRRCMNVLKVKADIKYKSH